jgi:hypothetical protein
MFLRSFRSNVSFACLLSSAVACADAGIEPAPASEVSSAASPLAVNLIANPSLETVNSAKPTEPQNWKPGSWGTQTTSFTYATDANTGSRSVRIDTTAYTSGDAKWIFDPVAVSAGTQYVYRDYYKSSIVTKLVAAHQLTDGTTVYQTLGTAPSSSTWTTLAFSVTPPAGSARTTVYHLIAGVGFLQLDDARFAVVDTPALDTGVPNGSLE